MCQQHEAFSRRRFFKYTFSTGASIVLATAGLYWPAQVEAALSEPDIIGCDTWGAQPPKEPITVLASRPDKIIVHHTATENSKDYSLQRAYELARAIQQSHFDRGFIDSGQHFTISRGGYALEGRHRSFEVHEGGSSHVQGAHCSNQNEVAVGIENEGTYTSVTPPQALYDRLVWTCAYICQQYGLSSSAIYGHRDFVATACPGDKLYAMLPQLRSDVQARLTDASYSARRWPLVQRGNTGERVKSVQYLLNQRGYNLTADGVFGSGTEGAVKNFQSAQGLPSDGIAGTRTWEKLILTLQKGSSGEAVRAVQSQLNSKGYSLTVDGIFGSGTEAAVKDFQSRSGLSADGIVGPNTWSKLVK